VGEVGDGVEDEIDVWRWNDVGVGAGVVTGLKFVLMMCKWVRCSNWVSKLGWSS
jgi:hypothetical protein